MPRTRFTPSYGGDRAPMQPTQEQKALVGGDWKDVEYRGGSLSKYDTTLGFWENPQYVAHVYDQLSNSTADQIPEWIDQPMLEMIYNEMAAFNGLPDPEAWNALPLDHPFTSSLQKLAPPPEDYLRDDPYFSDLFTIPEIPEASDLPAGYLATAGLTAAQYDALPWWKKLEAAVFGSGTMTQGDKVDWLNIIRRGASMGVGAGGFEEALEGIAGAAGTGAKGIAKAGLKEGIAGAIGGGLLAGILAPLAVKFPAVEKFLSLIEKPDLWMERKIGELGVAAYGALGSLEYGVQKALDAHWGNEIDREGIYTFGEFYEDWKDGWVGDIAQSTYEFADPSWMWKSSKYGKAQQSPTGEWYDVTEAANAAGFEGDWVGIGGMMNAMRIMKADPKNITPEVMGEMVSQLYGWTGQKRDMVFQTFASPWNVVPFMAVRGVGSVMKWAKWADFGIDITQGAWAIMSDAAKEARGPIDMTRRYWDKMVTSDLMSVADRAAMPKMLRYVSRIDDQGYSTKLLPIHKTTYFNDTSVLGRAKNAWRWIWGLDPASQARYTLGVLADNVSSEALKHYWIGDATVLPEVRMANYLKSVFGNPDNADNVKASALSRGNPMYEAGKYAFDSDMDKIVDNHLKTYLEDGLGMKSGVDSGRITLLNNIANTMGWKSETLLAMLEAHEGSADVLWSRIIKQVNDNPDAPGAQVFLKLVQDNKLNASWLAKTMDLYITKGHAYSADTFQATLLAKVRQHIDERMDKYYKVDAPPQLLRVGQAIKAAQSFVLLGLNPVYLVNNILNNAITMMAEGIFGPRTLSLGFRNKVWADVGFSPHRRDALAGLGAELFQEEISSITQSTKYGGVTGKIVDASRWLSDTFGITSKLSHRMERVMSDMSMTKAFLDYKSDQVRFGRLLDAMEIDLETRINALGGDYAALPDKIKQAFEAHISPAEIMNFINADVKYHLVDGLENVLAKNHPDITPAQIKQVFNELGLKDFLNERIKVAKDHYDVYKAFEDAKVELERLVTKDYLNQMRHDLQKYANSLEISGAQEYIYRRNQLDAEHYEMMQYTDQIIMQAYQDAAQGIPNAIPDAFDKVEKIWNERWSYETEFNKVFREVLGPRNRAVMIVSDLDMELATTWKEFYRQKAEIYRKHNNYRQSGVAPEDISADLSRAGGDIAELGQKAYAEELRIRKAINAAYVDMFEVAFGAAESDLMRIHFDEALKLRIEMTTKQVKFWDDVNIARKLEPERVNSMFQKFNNDVRANYIAQIVAQDTVGYRTTMLELTRRQPTNPASKALRQQINSAENIVRDWFNAFNIRNLPRQHMVNIINKYHTPTEVAVVPKTSDYVREANIAIADALAEGDSFVKLTADDTVYRVRYASDLNNGRVHYEAVDANGNVELRDAAVKDIEGIYSSPDQLVNFYEPPALTEMQFVTKKRGEGKYNYLDEAISNPQDIVNALVNWASEKVTERPRFIEFASRTKTLDYNKQPRKFYVNADDFFEVFDENMVANSADRIFLGEGYYLDADPDVARVRHEDSMIRRGIDPNEATPYSHEVWVNITNPAYVDIPDGQPPHLNWRLRNDPALHFMADILDEMNDPFTPPDVKMQLARDLQTQLIAAGYDGIMNGTWQLRFDDVNDIPPQLIDALKEFVADRYAQQGRVMPQDTAVVDAMIASDVDGIVNEIVNGGWDVDSRRLNPDGSPYIADRVWDVFYDYISHNTRLAVAFDSSQVKATLGPHLFDQNDPSLINSAEMMRIQLEMEDMAKLDPVKSAMGLLDSLDTEPPYMKGTQEYIRHIMPLIDDLKNAVIGSATDTTFKGWGDLDLSDPDNARIKAEVDEYIAKTLNDHMDGINEAVQYATYRTNMALLDYNQRTGLDHVSELLFPYQFWYTRSMVNWFTRTFDRPSYLAGWARFRKAQSDQEKLPGYPTRLNSKMRISMDWLPWMPEWAGGAIYADPFKNMFPMEFLIGSTLRLLGEETDKSAIEEQLGIMLEDEEITREQYEKVMLEMDGDIYEEAKLRAEQENISPLNLFTSIMNFSVPIDFAYKLVTGREDEISQLPLTRTASALASLAGQIPGLEFLQPGNRTFKGEPILDISKTDKWSPYRIQRELASMAAENPENADEIYRVQAANDTESPFYKEALRRVGLTQAARTFLGSFGVDFMTSGEQRQREIAQEYWAAYNYDKQNNYTTHAVTEFYDEHPEYRSYVMATKNWDDEEARQRTYAVGELWEYWYAETTSKTHQKQLKEQFGDIFVEKFITKSTRDISAIPTATLLGWTKALGLTVIPGEIQPEYIPIDLADEEQLKMIDFYYADRERKYGANIADISRMYHSLKVYDEQNGTKLAKDWLKKHPELVDNKQKGYTGYWSYTNSFKQAFPDLAEIMDYEDDRLMAERMTADLSPELNKALFNHLVLGYNLSPSAKKAAYNEWKYGDTGIETFDAWMNLMESIYHIPMNDAKMQLEH